MFKKIAIVIAFIGTGISSAADEANDSYDFCGRMNQIRTGVDSYGSFVSSIGFYDYKKEDLAATEVNEKQMFISDPKSPGVVYYLEKLVGIDFADFSDMYLNVWHENIYACFNFKSVNIDGGNQYAWGVTKIKVLKEYKYLGTKVFDRK